MADAMEMMLLSLLSPALACEWGISPMQQVSTSFFCELTHLIVVFLKMGSFWNTFCSHIIFLRAERAGHRMLLNEM